MSEPTAISQGITQSDLDAAVEANRAILQERFPDLDISIGGVIDSLLVDGASVITARNDADVDQIALQQQLRAIATGEVLATDEDVDRLMANYYLERREATPASGTVVFVVRDNTNYTFQAGYRLRTADQTYRLPRTVNIFPTTDTTADLSIETNVQIQRAYDEETGFEFRFELLIESLETSPDAVLVSGDRLVVDQAFDGLGYVQAVTNFSGGFPTETNPEFVSRGLSGITAQTVGGEDHIRAIVQATRQLSSSSGIGSGDPLMTRDRDNVFNLPTGGKVDIYVKSGAVAQAGYLNVTGVVQDVGTRTVRLTLSREQSAGVYRQELAPLYLSTPPTLVSGGLTVLSTTHLAWSDPQGFDPETPAEIDRAFSARQQIQIDFVDDRQDGSGYIVPMTSIGQLLEDTYRVSVEYQPGVLAQDQALTSEAVRPPGTDVLVKAAVPCTTAIGIIAAQPVEYNGPSGPELAASVATAVNQLPISTHFIDSLTLSAIVRSIEPSLVVQSVSLSGTVYGQNLSDISISPTAGRLSIPTNVGAKVSPDNTYFTTTPALTTVTLV